MLALEAAGERARGATAYVTLEPCAHTGHTGPCADALVAAGVARVVAAMRDPFPQVDGKGFERLQAAGIDTASGLMEAQARELNVGYLSRIERGRPWVRVKLAMSLDGRTALASGDSKWITGEAARLDGHRWRARAGAILTGAGTIMADDPQLTVRLGDNTPFVPPIRVVLDPGLATIARGRVREGDAPTVYLHASDAKPPRGLTVPRVPVPVSNGHLDLHAVMQVLVELGVNELHVETGATLAGALLTAGLVDELLLYVAPVLLGDDARPLFAGLRIVDPLAPDRKVGKVYIYPATRGWEVSGHYKRGDGQRWHPYLMRLDADAGLVGLSVRDDDARLRRKAGQDPKLTAEP